MSRKPCLETLPCHILVDVSDIFYFFCSGERERGESEAPRGGVVFIENPRRGGGGEGRGGCLRGIWGGWLNIFFRGRNSHQDILQAPSAGHCLDKHGQISRSLLLLSNLNAK